MIASRPPGWSNNRAGYIRGLPGHSRRTITEGFGDRLLDVGIRFMMAEVATRNM